MNKYLVLIILPFLILSCRSSTINRVKDGKMLNQNANEVSISVYGKAGGSAHFAIRNNGKVKGSHVSSDNPPRVHERESTVSKDIIDSIFNQAAKVMPEGLHENCVRDSNTASIVTITDSNGILHCYQETHDKPTINSELELLIDLLEKNSIGW